MNQFSFNLDQNYLQHDKFGAHYSKKTQEHQTVTEYLKEKRNAKRI